MGLPKELIEKHPALNEWAILTGWRGSIAHGMYIPQSNPDSIDDKDVMSICVPPVEYYFGLQQFHSRGTQEIKEGEWDVVCYELKKFASLLEKGNPNVISLLWLEPNHYLKITPAGQLLLDNRELFLSTDMYHSFVGYAHSQLKNMTHLAFEGYMGEKRKSLVQKYGYDTKNAAHLIRLLRMAIETLMDGKLQVQRQDAPELLRIKTGKWTLEEVKAEADRLFKLAQEAYVRSPLPRKVDRAKVNELLIRMTNLHFGVQK